MSAFSEVCYGRRLTYISKCERVKEMGALIVRIAMVTAVGRLTLPEDSIDAAVFASEQRT